MFKLFKSKKKPQKSLIVLGTDFGSYQFNQLVDASDEYQIAGFISDDSWQRKSGFANVGIFGASDIKEIFEREGSIAIILPSDQKETWLKSNDKSNGNPLQGLEDKVKQCDVLTIPVNVSSDEANRFLSELVSG